MRGGEWTNVHCTSAIYSRDYNMSGFERINQYQSGAQLMLIIPIVAAMTIDCLPQTDTSCFKISYDFNVRNTFAERNSRVRCGCFACFHSEKRYRATISCNSVGDLKDAERNRKGLGRFWISRRYPCSCDEKIYLAHVCDLRNLRKISKIVCWCCLTNMRCINFKRPLATSSVVK